MKRVFAVLALAATLINAETINARVVGIIDGDTLRIVREGAKKSEILRISGIDAPELAQNLGGAAKARLSKLAFGKRVKIDLKGRERYGRALGRVRVGKKDLGGVLVREGLAFDYKNKGGYAREQNYAKERNLGVWGAGEKNPWDYRKKAR